MKYHLFNLHGLFICSSRDSLARWQKYNQNTARPSQLNSQLKIKKSLLNIQYNLPNHSIYNIYIIISYIISYYYDTIYLHIAIWGNHGNRWLGDSYE